MVTALLDGQGRNNVFTDLAKKKLPNTRLDGSMLIPLRPANKHSVVL